MTQVRCNVRWRMAAVGRLGSALPSAGAMFHRAPLMVFGQFKFMDGSVLGSAVTPFRKMYMRFGGYGNYEIMGYRHIKHMAARIKRKVFIQEYIANTPPVVATTPLRLEEAEAVCREMERESLIIVNGNEITAPIILGIVLCDASKLLGGG